MCDRPINPQKKKPLCSFTKIHDSCKDFCKGFIATYHLPVNLLYRALIKKKKQTCFFFLPQPLGYTYWVIAGLFLHCWVIFSNNPAVELNAVPAATENILTVQQKPEYKR